MFLSPLGNPYTHTPTHTHPPMFQQEARKKNYLPAARLKMLIPHTHSVCVCVCVCVCAHVKGHLTADRMVPTIPTAQANSIKDRRALQGLLHHNTYPEERRRWEEGRRWAANMIRPHCTKTKTREPKVTSLQKMKSILKKRIRTNGCCGLWVRQQAQGEQG